MVLTLLISMALEKKHLNTINFGDNNIYVSNLLVIAHFTKTKQKLVAKWYIVRTNNRLLCYFLHRITF